MPLSKENYYTSEDYWNLPDGERAELINGKFYDIAPPSRIHQELISGFNYAIRAFIERSNGNCEVYPAPFAVNLDADDRNWVEPDISVICDPGKLTDRGCSGAPDLVIEVVSPSSRRHDYMTKANLYFSADVREYWIVDQERERVTVYHFEVDAAPVIYTFSQDVPVGIYGGFSINVAKLLK